MNNDSGDTDLKVAKDNESYFLRLFVTGASPNSVRAISNIKDICDRNLGKNYELEIIDVHQQPAMAETEQILALPLLVRKFPLPERRLIGDLSDTEKVLKNLGILGQEF